MEKLSILLVLLILFTSSLCCPEDKKQALLQFKASLINATASSKRLRVKFETWNFSSDCCNWDMVSCSSRFGARTVIARDLQYLVDMQFWDSTVLSSTILTPLFHIRSMIHLDLSLNKIQGELTGDGFANFSKLVYLDMHSNGFNCFIPSQLFHLRYLQHLDISSNSIHGILIGEVGSLSSLRVLSLDYNSLGGNISKEIGNMTKL